MLRAEPEKVFIEHCIGCKSHMWCTNHDEEKYTQLFLNCKNAIYRSIPNVTVAENMIPPELHSKFITDPNISVPGKFHFPRIGSFEVYFRGVAVFSKISSMKWPTPSKIVEKLKGIQEAAVAKEGRVRKVKEKRLLSAVVGKKKKGKKTKKRSKKEKVKIPRSIPKVRPMSRDQPFRNANNEFREVEIPRFSVSDSPSDSEQPVPPYGYKAQTKPSEKEKITIEDLRGPSQKYGVNPGFDQIPKKEPTPVLNPPVSKLPAKLSSSESSERRKSESPNNFDSSDYQSSSSSSNKKQPEFLQKSSAQANLNTKKESSESYKSESYEEDKSSKKSSKSSSKSSSKKSLPKEKFSPEKAFPKKPASEEPSEKYSSEKYSSEKYSSDKESEKQKSEDYEDSDFEEEEQVHPLREIDKSYNVKLPLAEESKKKITYQNMTDSDAVFEITSSHPEYMAIKEEDLTIGKGQKGKIQLRFAPMFSGEEKKYYIYIDREGEPWECIEIVAEYEE